MKKTRFFDLKKGNGATEPIYLKRCLPVERHPGGYDCSRSASGQSRPGRADSRFGNVGFPLIATDFCGAATFRDVLGSDLRGDLHLISARANLLELDRNSGAEFLICALLDGSTFPIRSNRATSPLCRTTLIQTKPSSIRPRGVYSVRLLQGDCRAESSGRPKN
jgi:hypothetical protein